MTFRKEVLAEGVELYNADCREVLPTLGKVDAVVTDPPYLDGNLSFILQPLLNVARRDYITDSRVVLTPGKQESFNWIYECKPVWEYAWQCATKTTGGAACFHIGFEPILAYAFPVTPLGNDLLNFPIQSGPDKPDHPWPKPIKLMECLVRHWSREGETVFDPFMGSGTTGVACVKLGRKFIGIEIEERYFSIACKRIEAALREPDLFIKSPNPTPKPTLLPGM